MKSDSSNILSDNCAVFVGEHKCAGLIYVSDFKLVCTLPDIGGEALDVTLREDGMNKAVLPEAVSYRPLINYRKMFDQFVSYGVGGMTEQIEELYRRAFASRGKQFTHCIMCYNNAVKSLYM